MDGSSIVQKIHLITSLVFSTLSVDSGAGKLDFHL